MAELALSLAVNPDEFDQTHLPKCASSSGTRFE